MFSRERIRVSLLVQLVLALALVIGAGGRAAAEVVAPEPSEKKPVGSESGAGNKEGPSVGAHRVDSVVVLRAGFTGQAVPIGSEARTDPDGCVWTIYENDDLLWPIYLGDASTNKIWKDKTPVPEWTDTPHGPGWRLFSATGRWFRAEGCNAAGRNGIYPEGDSTSLPALVGQALDTVDPPTPPSFGTSPPSNGSDRFSVVRIPTWFWIDEPYRSDVHTGRAAFPAGSPRVWVEAEAAPEQVQVKPGDGAAWQDACPALGLIYRSGMAGDRSDCFYTYTKSSAGQPGDAYQAQGRVWFETSWTTNIPGVGGEVADPIFRDAAPQIIQVGEIQSVAS